MITTTLKDLRKHGACFEGYNRVVRSIQGKEFSKEDANRDSYIRFAHKGKIDLLSILESNGVDDAWWSLRASNASDRDMRLFAVWCAREVEHLNTDPRVKACNDVAERFANGKATLEELDAAVAAVGDAAQDAVRAAQAAARAAAGDAAWDAAGDAAEAAARDAQKKMFVKMCNGEAPWQKEEK